MTRIATVEEVDDLPLLKIKDPTDLKTNRWGELLVVANVNPASAPVPGVEAMVADQVGIKAEPGTLYRALFNPGEAWAGQIYFQAFNANAAVALGTTALWSVPLRLSDSPIAELNFQEKGMRFTTGIVLGLSLDPHEWDNAAGGLPDGTVTVLFA
jgi:hypothetical protein